MQELDNKTKQELTAYLGNYLTKERKAKMEEVLSLRTRRLALVLEDIYQPHNAAATLRTCECLGVNDVHVIENRNHWRPNKGVSMGSNKWLNITRWQKNEQEATLQCFNNLRSQGCSIIATSLDEHSIDLPDIDLSKPVAVVFGTEEIGLTPLALEQADAHLRLPMFGFTQSYNVSVSVAITFSNLVLRLHQRFNNWGLTEQEKIDTRLQWYRSCLKRIEMYEEEFFTR